MPERRYARMAHPRSGAATQSQRTAPSRASAARTSTSRQPTTRKPQPDTWLRKAWRWLWSWLTGPAGQQILALALIALGAVSLITLIPGINSGELVTAWVHFLVLAFGWAAYPVAAFIIAGGLLWLRHPHQPTTWRWRPLLGFELALIGLQTLTFNLIKQPGWLLIESGKGGGVIGWALYLFLSDYLGRLITGLLMGLVTLLGVALVLDLTHKDVMIFWRRLSEVWAAWRDAQAARAEARAERRSASHGAESQAYSPAAGVAVSPLGKTATSGAPPAPQSREGRMRSRSGNHEPPAPGESKRVVPCA